MELTDTMLTSVARRFASLADESRLKLLIALRQAPANVTALAAAAGIAQPSVTKHLAVLRDVGLVDCKKAGTSVVYHVSDASVFGLCKIVCEGVARHAKTQQAQLQALLAPSPKRRAR
jgi:DNA-binding transcriptional ArsR family regulator